MKSTSKRPAVSATPNADSLENKGGLSALVTLLLSPIRRHRIANLPAAKSPNHAIIPPSSTSIPIAKPSTTSRPDKRTAERRKSLQAMLGSDAVFNSFIAVAQKVFNVPIAVVCHVQTGPGASKGHSCTILTIYLTVKHSF